VLLPSRILSNAPILVNILSAGVNKHFSAGTKHPIYASTTARQVYLNNVDFPPIFGPVTSIIKGSFSSKELSKEFFLSIAFSFFKILLSSSL
jgi:hypothetical protein